MPTQNNQNDELTKPSGIFISDCGILFVPNESKDNNDAKLNSLRMILNAVREINCEMLKEDIILTTSIAYGNFNYTSRFNHEYIEKNLLYGDAYIYAYFDNENGLRGKSGQCRIVNDEKIYELIKNNKYKSGDILSLLLQNYNDSHRYYYYFYWMLKHPNPRDIKIFKTKYNHCLKNEFKWDCIKKLFENFNKCDDIHNF